MFGDNVTYCTLSVSLACNRYFNLLCTIFHDSRKRALEGMTDSEVSSNLLTEVHGYF